MDMATPLHHAWTYQALCTDLLAFKQNRCSWGDLVVCMWMR